MTLGDVIARIQSQCPGFAHVDHVLTSPADFTRPAALVTPVRYRGAQPTTMFPGSYEQDVDMVFGVFLVLERRQNGVLDNGTADEFDTLLTSVRAALVNWPSDGAGLAALSMTQPITYAGGELAPYEPGNVTWRDDYAAQIEMRMP